MKSLLALAITAVTLTSAQSNARSDCPSGQGYWEEVYTNVRVCDTKQETYTVTFKDCRYTGVVYRGQIWHQPQRPWELPSSKVVNEYDYGVSSCPDTKYYSEHLTYGYIDSYGNYRTDFVSYTGTLFKGWEDTRSETRTREIKTNCRTEQRVTYEFRCGFEP
ncbi:hypothetical protein [Pseudoalteromonas luteoviolacea]|uniref:Uncharacterized protein n=1 Tax=Pseudoalteromonas luteoviolacea H33 TaxID=1365251 RepID=A0A166ZU13_9GAMM|nr:hypothetical protein [Pseudoalteromonas luteoviolacea]KZN44665.1 hypothetical protein N476_26200 [Pseudoalteromonas luteoviolacea H33]KZN71975.1 hypothetical protein N477_25545 [Pseudoalteromonas luteoviolacea H33-S]MBQ4878715.1 hypothetical protein [Pseudoalteromonas luteoviolacea]MBQ4907255.1 hypothetical protein [Pseudoalteromonas luteoviolacea]